MTIVTKVFCLALIVAFLCGCGRNIVEEKQVDKSAVKSVQTVSVGDSISDAEEKILGSGGKRVTVPLEPLLPPPTPRPPGATPLSQPAPTIRKVPPKYHRVYKLSQGSTVVLTVLDGRIVSMTRETLDDGTKSLQEVRLEE